MATYYQHGGQEMQQEGLQTLYLMNPGYPSYADATNNPQQQFLGIPQQPTPPASNPNIDFSSLQGFSFNAHPLLWGSAVPPQLGLRHQKGLSLSLSPQQTPHLPAPEMPPDYSSETGLPNCLSGLQSFCLGSKYLKVAQQLLDEVVGVKGASLKITEETQLRSIKEAEAMEKHVAELITAKGQELQMKNVKLVNMLKEVEQRYKQYHNQMKIVVSSFEAMAGIGAARTYTALALQTISKQFRDLRDAISVQIHATSKSLAEEGSLGDKFQSSRNQRSLQRIGMIQHNAWRPQRGLPGRSVSILRAWLFEHFLHPYPKDSDKQMLAKQTGLTKSQVSNWFINARVRLWKPMVEDMYLEELKGVEQNNGDEKRSKLSNTNGESTSKSNVNQGISPERTEKTNQQTHSALQVIGQSKPNRVRSNESIQSNTVQHTVNVEFGSKDMESQGYSLLRWKMSNGGYSIEQLERFDAKQFAPRVMGKGVSLTLGLPNCENPSLSRGHSSYLSADIIPLGRRAEIGSSINELCGHSKNASVAHASNN